MPKKQLKSSFQALVDLLLSPRPPNLTENDAILTTGFLQSTSTWMDPAPMDKP